MDLRFKIDPAGDVLQPAIAAGDVRREHGLRYPVVDRVADQLTEGFTAERGIAPNDASTFDASRDRVEGRKRWVTRRLGPPDGRYRR